MHRSPSKLKKHCYLYTSLIQVKKMSTRLTRSQSQMRERDAEESRLVQPPVYDRQNEHNVVLRTLIEILKNDPENLEAQRIIWDTEVTNCIEEHRLTHDNIRVQIGAVQNQVHQLDAVYENMNEEVERIKNIGNDRQVLFNEFKNKVGKDEFSVCERKF